MNPSDHNESDLKWEVQKIQIQLIMTSMDQSPAPAELASVFLSIINNFLVPSFLHLVLSLFLHDNGITLNE